MSSALAKQNDVQNHHSLEAQTYESSHTPDTQPFRQLVQDWRIHGDPESFPRQTRVQKTYTPAQLRWARAHRKRAQAVLNGQTATPPGDLSQNQVLLQEFSRSEPVYIDELPPEDVTFVSLQYHKPESLYVTLLRILRSSNGIPPTLASLVKFHREQPVGCRTARSYNLLLLLCLRHASFSTAEALIKQMKREGITPTQDTKKLILRLWTLTGRWEWAWRMCRQEYGGSPLPLFLWMEFFQGMKRGAFRRFGHRHGHTPKFHVLREDEDVLRRRFTLLMRNMPSLSEQERTDMPSRVVYLLVREMLRFGWQAQARRLTREHLIHLPSRQLSPKELHNARNIIHLHMLTHSRSPPRISDFIRMRADIIQLFDLHPLLTPSPTTLFLLLSALRRTKCCGTLSRSIARQFQRRWGEHMVDRRVSRRLAYFALKQGQIGAAIELIDRRQIGRQGSLSPEDVTLDLSRSRTKQPPFRDIFKRRGLENRKRGLLLRRVHHRRLTGDRVTAV